MPLLILLKTKPRFRTSVVSNPNIIGQNPTQGFIWFLTRRQVGAWNAFAGEVGGERSCPRSATAIHSVIADRVANLSLERQTLYHWAIAAPI